MIAAVIRWSIGNRILVLILTVMLTAWGLYSVSQTPVDALPDLSDVQVIIKTSYLGVDLALALFLNVKLKRFRQWFDV